MGVVEVRGPWSREVGSKAVRRFGDFVCIGMARVESAGGERWDVSRYGRRRGGRDFQCLSRPRRRGIPCLLHSRVISRSGRAAAMLCDG